MLKIKISLFSFFICSLFWISTPVLAEQTKSETERGKFLGAKMSTHPSWFKTSFLEIGDDVEEAADEGRHVILFMEMNGCPYCFKMIEENFKTSSYTDFIQENFDVIALNIKGDREVALNSDTSATEKKIAEIMKVRYTPTVIFLDKENNQVARINGYRNAKEFKHVLDYVKEEAYKNQKLSAYLDNKKKTESYSFRSHSELENISDLSQIKDRPLAILFEDSACIDCDKLHDGYLNDPEVKKSLEKMAFVRVDALSDAEITDPQGNKITQKAFADQLGITYRPSIVLFDEGREIVRIESMLYGFHFSGVLEYVAGRHYKEYPESPFRYLDVKTEQMLSEGKNVNISK